MPTFTTPEPITLTIELPAGDVRILATDRDDTVATVRASDSSHEPDVRAAEQTRVEFVGGRLLIKAPKQRGLGLFSRGGSIDVTVELPAGSQLEGDTAAAAFHCSGRLGQCRVRTSAGDLQLDGTGTVDLHTGTGLIAVNHAAGDAEVHTGSGKIRLGEVDGTAVVKNSNGDNWIGRIGGDLRVNTANGDILVDQAQAGVNAATANGDVRIGEIVRGSISLKTAYGQIEIGIRSGTAARLDVHTSFGRVHNQLNAVDGPEATDEKVEVRANTSYGDILIRSANPAPAFQNQEKKL